MWVSLSLNNINWYRCLYGNKNDCLMVWFCLVFSCRLGSENVLGIPVLPCGAASVHFRLSFDEKHLVLAVQGRESCSHVSWVSLQQSCLPGFADGFGAWCWAMCWAALLASSSAWPRGRQERFLVRAPVLCCWGEREDRPRRLSCLERVVAVANHRVRCCRRGKWF